MMLAARTRGVLDRYALASRAPSGLVGERSRAEPGQSVEFHDYRPYQPGDELRYVDWRAYARTGRLYTRLYQAERAVKLHLVLDASLSMSLHGKGEYARTLMRLLTYVGQRDAPTQLHVLGGPSAPPARGFSQLVTSWRFIEEAGGAAAGAAPPITALTSFALNLPRSEANSLALIISDLLEDAPLRPALAALRARGLDAGFLHVISDQELNPTPVMLELEDVETGGKLPVGPAEVAAYREELRLFLSRTRSVVTAAGCNYLLLTAAPAQDEEARERNALRDLIRAGFLLKR